MPISHTKAFGVYHWDTFDNRTLLVHEADSKVDARIWVEGHCDIQVGGADEVDIVDGKGDIMARFHVV